MAQTVLTRKMTLNLVAIFASVGTLATILPVPHTIPSDYGSGTGDHVAFNKVMLGVFLPK